VGATISELPFARLRVNLSITTGDRFVRLALLLCSALTLTNNLFSADDASDWKPGLIGEYFAIGTELMDFPSIAAEKKPNITKVDRVINIPHADQSFNDTSLTDQFYIRWTGAIKIEKDGKYTFFTESDDGSRLFIDGKPVVENGGNHGMIEKSGEVELKAGTHDIKMEFFEDGGGAGCVLKWQPPASEKAVIPANVLFHKKGADQ